MRTNLALLCLILLAGCAPVFSQNKPADPRQPDSQKTTQQRPASDNEDVVRISVTLVQLDAVVTDKKGNPVTNLQKDDFEIYEDGKRQLITNFSFVSKPAPSSPSGPVPKLAPQVKGAPVPLPPVRLKPEQVHRTIAIVVDDLSLSMGSAESVQYYLRRFVERQMEPGDLVAIIRASGGMGALQQFTADKRQLRAAVDRIRWNPQSDRIGVFKPISDETMQSVLKGTIRNDQLKEQLESESTDFREQLFTVGMLGALNYVVRGLRELPGRKSVMLFSEGFTIGNPDAARNDSFGRTTSRVQASLNRLVEFANRSAVVLYAIDPRGLVVPMLEAGDDTAGLTPQQMSDIISRRMHQVNDPANGLNYLAKQTGGFVVSGSNDLSRSIKRVLDDQSGYYLIGYVPAESTFKRIKGQMPFHKTAVKVKRADLNVRTRGGFYGVTNEEARPAPRTPMQQLTAAVTSPFNSGDVRLRLTSLFGNDSLTGYYVRSLLHIDARDLSFSDEPDGWKSASIDVAAITFGDNGIVVDQNIQQYTLRIRGDSFDRTLRSGIVYTIDLPLKKPGAYQLRTAVRDSKTEHIGSANQYIEVPNVNKGRLVVSAMALSGNDIRADLNRIQSGLPDDLPAASETRAAAGLAVRKLRPGDNINYAFVIYNARIDKATSSPQLIMQARLFRDGKLIFEGEAAPLRLSAQKDWKRINVAGSMALGKTARPGDYIFQIVITDTLAKEKYRTISQWMDFEIEK